MAAAGPLRLGLLAMAILGADAAKDGAGPASAHGKAALAVDSSGSVRLMRRSRSPEAAATHQPVHSHGEVETPSALLSTAQGDAGARTSSDNQGVLVFEDELERAALGGESEAWLIALSREDLDREGLEVDALEDEEDRRLLGSVGAPRPDAVGG
mmetsp:Transcript_90740/g.256910  ORF Transcript_90740/g.256910 Transcript_90740/m.256910 type:complete len:155 (+) Transcript_90740:92-556(+)